MILTLIDHDLSTLNPLSREALTFARHLAGQLNTPLEAIVVGASAPETLSEYGVTRAHVVNDLRLALYAPEAWARGVMTLIETLQPQAVLAAGNERGQEVLAHVAARLNLPMAANVLEARSESEAWIVTRQRWGGSLLEEARLTGAVKLLTVAPNVILAESAPAVAFTINEVAVTFSDKDFRTQVKERVASGEGKISLGEARWVVGGGRGVGSAEGFKVLEELVELLGGAVGCSRAVTSSGWRPHMDQIGQTGTRITAELYIACGISGATQHIVGCKGAKRILAINTDPDAPIMAHADYAVIGDLHAVLPAISAAIKAMA